MLVVEGLVTNDSTPYIIKLSLSKQSASSVTRAVSDATVSISDETGNITTLNETESGIYRTDSLLFKGEIGKTYQLHIKTSNGNEYVSDSCQMLPVPEIDTIYYEKDEKFLHNETVAREGLSIYLGLKPGEGKDYFLRWDYDETWKFKVPDPALFDYINDTIIIPIPPNEYHELCYKSNKSSDILTGEVSTGIISSLKGIPIQFIAPEESDRLTIRYSIQVDQYSISQKEFSFWNDLKEVDEPNGGIFGSQPFSVLSNVKNINNPTEPVLGYFQVSAVTRKRIYIDFNNTLQFDLPFYHYNCMTIHTPIFMYTSGYDFVEPVYDLNTGKLSSLIFTSTECADCRVTGTETKPDFWTDK
jgi:hypothetical protein